MSFIVLIGCSQNNEERALKKSEKKITHFEKTENGVIVSPASGTAQTVRLQVISDTIIRVTAVPDKNLAIPESLMVVAKSKKKQTFTLSEIGETLKLSTKQISADISLQTGKVDFYNINGERVLSEKTRTAFNPVTADPANSDSKAYSVRQTFSQDSDEGLYGLGQHQNGQFNYSGENVELAQHNLVIVNPFLVSSRHYGLLWDNNSITRVGDSRKSQALGKTLRLFDKDGKEGGLSAHYYLADKLVLTRTEAEPNYQYLKDQKNWPEAVKDKENQRVVWEGSIAAQTSGKHRFRMYSSGYAKLFINDTLLLDRWRQDWNPWYHNINLEMSAGEKKSIRIEWTPQKGYLRLSHLDPLPEHERQQLSLASESANAIDYYFVGGESMDDVIAGYRQLTGQAVLLPRRAYGFRQSRQRYKTQDELLDIVKQYRERKIPFDNIVLDWFYWNEDDWGSHQFDAKRFPDPKAMVDQVHAMNAQIMISIWPKFYPTTDNYKELDKKGYIYRRNVEKKETDWVGKGYQSSFYDPYNEKARELYWRQIKDNLNVLGFDAWWLDATEPDIHSNLDINERKLRMGPTAVGSGAHYFNSYALPHAEGVYQGERETDPHQRAFILTRSGFGGLQRTPSAVWSGDVVARWSNLEEQISAGINVSLSGLPNWTFDIGGFSVEERYKNQDPDHLDEWRELNLRWFQFGAFVPLFRSHGEFPYREIFNIAPEGSPVYNSMRWYTELRYRLMPYIYSLAGDTYHKHGSIMRALVMDFPKDKEVKNIGDQYLFGPSILVNPVYTYQSRSRDLYLPAGVSWYDFYTGTRIEGGQRIEAAAPLKRMPLFIKAGSILPIGPSIQYTDEKLDAPITLWVYTGADGSFELYEDDGKTYEYEQGAWSRIAITYEHKTKTLSIGERVGSFPSMNQQRIFKVRWISDSTKDAIDFDAPAHEELTYNGQALSLQWER
ncbi:MAG: DUF5110 domain-containing protein [Spongiibacteraceae bacterium]|nr:DUF5110 domain-containing protein [Spongiibacteraceae bacterium]